MKLKKYFWGLFFLLAGVAVIVGQLGYLGDIHVFTLVLTIFLVSIICKSIPRAHFFGILIPLALIGVLYAEALGITALTPWPILFTAVFVSAGLSIIFHSSKWYQRCNFGHSENFDAIIDEADEGTVQVKVHFGSSIKYVNSDPFEKGIFECSFGALKVYFDNAKVGKDGATIFLTSSFGGVELYIPKEWKVVNDVSASMGGIEEKHRSVATDGPVVTIKGNISFSGVEIIYI